MTDVIQLLSFLDNILGTHIPQQRNEYVWPCPFCSHHKPKLAVNLATGQWHCWVCQTGGRSLFSLLKRMDSPKTRRSELAKLLDQEWKFTEQKEESETVLTLPSEYKPLWKVGRRDMEGRHALAYLKGRGITMDDVMKYQLGYCPFGEYGGRVIIPSYDENLKLNFFVGRGYYESSLPYKNPKVSKNIVGFESLVSWKFPIVICEGPMDAMAIRRNAIPLFGSSLQSKLRDKIISAEVEEVILALDADALKQAYKIAYDFIKQGLNVYIIEMQGRDPNELGFEFMRNEIRNQRDRVSFSDIVKRRTALV